MLALNIGGVRYPWLSAPVLALLGGALVLGIGFVMRLLTAVEPLIPIVIVSDPASRLAILANCFGWGSIIGLNIFLPMYLQSVLGWSATDSGLSLMILMVTLNVSAGLSSQLIGRVKRYKLVPSVFLVVGIAAVLALSFSVSTMTPLKFEIILFLIGVGFGPTPPLTQVALQNTVPGHDLGAAIGTMNFARTLVGTILIAVFGAIVLAGVPLDTPAGALSQRILAGTSVTGFATVFLAAAGALTVTFVALLLLEEKPLLTTLPGSRS
jgi:MFS family permease